MTYDSDPTRWTQAPGAAPDVLRDAFHAARTEGPSDLQMQALTLKLAALSGGAALAASSSAAQASAAVPGAAAATAGGSAVSFAKVAMSIALVGAAATGAVFYQAGRDLRSADPAPRTTVEATEVAVESDEPVPTAAAGTRARKEAAAVRERAPAAREQPVAAAREPAPAVTREQAPAEVRGSAIAAEPSAAAAAVEPSQVAEAPAIDKVDESPLPTQARAEADESASAVRSPARSSSAKREQRRTRAERRARSSASSTSDVESRGESAAPRARDTQVAHSAAEGERSAGAPLPEIQLLRRARASLATQPQETYRWTQVHRRDYPQGVFAQERDALAIEALLRAGERAKARSLAEEFIKLHPSSPHAHRFRETMEIP